MLARPRAALLLAASSLFVACSSNNSASVLPQRAQTVSAVRTAGAMPTPLSLAAESGIRTLGAAPTNVEHVALPIPGAALGAMPHTVPSTPAPSGIHPMDNVMQVDQGGQAGYIVSGGSNAGNGDVYVAMSVQADTWINTPASGYNLLYAPTTHGPNGNCLEVSTDYYNGWETTGTTVRQVQFWDFCANGWAGAIPIDYNFLQKYARVYANGDGLPQYLVEIAKGADTKWHAYIYNNQNGDWDDVYDSAAGASTTTNDSDGWSIFETHYTTGECSFLPAIGESDLRLHYSTDPNQGWLQANTDASYYPYAWGQCFYSATGTNTWPIYTYTPGYAGSLSWTVTD